MWGRKSQGEGACRTSVALFLFAIMFLTQHCELKKVVRLFWFGLVCLCPAPTKLYHFQIVAGTLPVTGEAQRAEMGQQKTA